MERESAARSADNFGRSLDWRLKNAEAVDSDRRAMKSILHFARHRRRIEALLCDDLVRQCSRERTLFEHTDTGARITEVSDNTVHWNADKVAFCLGLAPADSRHEIYGVDYSFDGAPRGGRARSLDHFPSLRQLMNWATRHWHEATPSNADDSKPRAKFNFAHVTWHSPRVADDDLVGCDHSSQLVGDAPTYVFSYGGAHKISVSAGEKPVKCIKARGNNCVLILNRGFRETHSYKTVGLSDDRRITPRARMSIVLRCVRTDD